MWDLPWWVTFISAWTIGSIIMAFLLGKIIALDRRGNRAAKNIQGVYVKRGRHRRQRRPETRLGRARVFER
jgi:hypothetical protein